MLVHKSLELRVGKSRERLVWAKLGRVGRRMMVEVVYSEPSKGA